jgi:hypothetical protein
MTKKKKAKQKTSKLKKWSLIGFATTAVLSGIFTAGGEKIADVIFSKGEDEKALEEAREKNKQLTSSLNQVLAENKKLKEEMKKQIETDKVYALWDKDKKNFKYFHEINHYDSNVMTCLANGNVSYLMSSIDKKGNSVIVPMRFKNLNRGLNNKLFNSEALKIPPELMAKSSPKKQYGPLLK